MQARAEKLGLPVDPAFGDDVLKAVSAAINQSDETKQLLAESMKQEKK